MSLTTFITSKFYVSLLGLESFINFCLTRSAILDLVIYVLNFLVTLKRVFNKNQLLLMYEFDFSFRFFFKRNF